MSDPFKLVLVVAACGLLLGCGGLALPSEAPAVPQLTPTDQTKCSVRKSQLRPLIVEWPAADRAALEARMRHGPVVVRYNGCELELLRRCRAPGVYKYASLTPKRETVTILDEDDLYANIPIYAAKFEGVLAQHKKLEIDMTIVGMYEADRSPAKPAELQGSCAGATHQIDTFTVGSFAFFAGGGNKAGASLSVAGAGAGVRHRAERTSLRQEGSREACGHAAAADVQPPSGCGGLLRLEVVALGKATDPPARAAGAPLSTAAPPAERDSPPVDDEAPAISAQAVASPAASKARSRLAPADQGYVDAKKGAGWGNRCFAHIKAGDLDFARAACQRGLALGPGPYVHGAILYSLAVAEQKAGNDEAACAHLRASLRVRPGSAPVRKKLNALGCKQ